MNLSLNLVDFAALSPMLILLLGAVIVLLLEAFTDKPSDLYSSLVTTLAISASIVATLINTTTANPLLLAWLRYDSVAQSFTLLFLLIGLATVLLSSSFFERYKVTQGEFYFLLLSALIGLILIGQSADFLTLFIGLETLSLSLYVLCGYMKEWAVSREAAVKYFLMGAISASFLVYGIAMIYGATGTTHLDVLASAYQNMTSTTEKALFLGGVALVTVALVFKAALVPFHMWAPDVYEGASTPVTAFMSVGTKAGAFAAFAVIFLLAMPKFDVHWNQMLAFLAYPTLLYANLVALRQSHLRRFFAYSGISHAGYLLFPIIAGTADSMYALFFYLIVYAIATLGCFAIMAFLDKHQGGVTMRDLHGLFFKAPFCAAVLTLCLLTLAGIPPTAGFFAKFYVFKVAFEAGYHALVIFGLLTAVISAFYYLRIISWMFTEAPSEDMSLQQTLPAALVAVLSFVALVFVAVYPSVFAPFW